MSTLLLLTSPPASGKTFWIRSFSDACEEIILVISPLRALADECRSQWPQKILIMTPEEWLVKRPATRIVIFDEFHLLTYWGDTFRPVMKDVFEELSVSSELVIGLTATLSEKPLEMAVSFRCAFDEIIWIDHGNQSLKWKPERYVRGPGKLIESILLHLSVKKTSLVFCQYREEVLLWERRLKNRGFVVWSCLGGEASAFARRVERESPPDFIVATTVLSHGVNLPTISRVFLLYRLSNVDFWIQMIARGGRKGEKFEVFALEPPYGLRWCQGRNLLRLLLLALRIFPSILLDQLDQCFLKESSSTASPTRNAISS